MHRCTIEEKVFIIYARARPFVYLCMAAGESRDHFNHKGKECFNIAITELSGWTDATETFSRVFEQGYKGTILQLSNLMATEQQQRTEQWAAHFVLHCEKRRFMERILAKTFSHILPLLSVVQWQSLTAVWWLKHQLKMALLVLCEMKGGGDLGDLELQWRHWCLQMLYCD